MKTAKIILAIAVLGFLGNSVQAQTYTDLYYTVGIPMGETADKIDGDASWRSFGFEWGQHLEEDRSIGFELGWHVYSGRESNARIPIGDNGTGILQGTKLTYYNIFPMQANYRYFLGDGDVRPFVGLAVGTTFISERIDMGIYSVTSDRFRFSGTPEIGGEYWVHSRMRVFVSARYFYAFQNKQDDIDGLGDPFSSLMLRIGIRSNM
jgi:hypothetical protein